LQHSTILRAARRAALTAGVAWATLGLFGAAWAGDAASSSSSAPPQSQTTSEGSTVTELVVVAERDKAAAAAPSKASLDETQPEAIITQRFIDLATPDSGDYTTVVLIAPSMAGITSNGGGVGETNKITLRGFKDGQFNVTYDGVSYSDTNDPTHHPASFWPSSTIGAAVVDRGPGTAGDLGQANYGGAIHFFSPVISDAMGATQKITYGTFNTQDYVTTLQSGTIAALGGGKLLLNFDERTSDGELSRSSGVAFNQLAKYEMPLGENFTLTAFAAKNYTRFYQADAGPGETFAQTQLYGKDFALNDNPADEHYYKWNHQKKNTDFEYIDIKGDLRPGLRVEDQLYSYYYANKTIATDDVTGLVGGPNTSKVTFIKPPGAPAPFAAPSTDIGGYDKLNRYRVIGDIVRVSQDFSMGTLRVGALWEWSDTDRHNLLLDLTQGLPDLKYKSVPPAVVIAHGSNAKTQERSNWTQYQVFADFEWRPMENLTITPGLKYVNFERDINAAVENSGVGGFVRAPVHGSNTYSETLAFLTANYKIVPDWSVYAQAGQGFLVPSLSTLQVNNLSLNALQPTRSDNFQVGTVFTRGRITADADIYHINITNLEVPDPTNQFYINAGTGNFSGVEGEVAIALDGGFTLFANGSTNDSNFGGQALAGLPDSTFATGVLFEQGPWEASVTYKYVGRAPAVYNTTGSTVYLLGAAPLANNQAYVNPAYDTLNASLAYDFGRFKVKLSGYNLSDRRTITSVGGLPTGTSAAHPGDTLYTYEAGRQIQLTVSAKF
jgi:iron complex outermembrane receptor protein